MSNRIMYKTEAEDYCHKNGYKLFLDFCIREKVIVLDDVKTVIHFEHNTLDHGTIRLQTTVDGLELWVGGKLKYQWCKDDNK